MTVSKRLLVLTPRFPYPVIGGDRLRIARICRALSADFQVTLLSMCESREELTYMPADGLFAEIHRVYLPRWRSYLNVALALPGAKPLQLAYYHSREFRRKVDTLLPKHDLALAHLVRTGQYLDRRRLSGWPATPTILEMTDAISLNYERLQPLGGISAWKKLLYRVEQVRLDRYERETLSRFQRLWLTSMIDRDFLDSDHSQCIDVIPNGVDLQELRFRTPDQDGNVIVFIGNMTSSANQDACHYFIREILPGVRRSANVTFRIVGNAPDAVIRQFQHYDHVEMTGRLERISDGVEGGFCGVCPTRAGAGIQNKVLEYLALGLPCVTSTLGVGGIEAEPDKHLFVYRSPGECVRQILALHADPALRIAFAAAGRSLVASRYNWDRVYSAFRSAAQATMPESSNRLADDVGMEAPDLVPA